MKSAATTLHHLEGAVRPCAARWLTNKSIVVCSTSGTIALQSDYNNSASTILRMGFGIGRLQRIPASNAVLAFNDETYEIIRQGDHGLTMRAMPVPQGVGHVGACVISQTGQYVLASRDGSLWTSSDGSKWVPQGKLTIHNVTIGCALSDDHYLFGSAHGEVELITLAPFSVKVSQRLHADAVQDLLPLNDRMIVSVSRDRALRVWRVVNGFELQWSMPALHEHFINCIAKVADQLWTGSSDGSIAITSITERTKVNHFKHHSDSVRILDLSHDGSKLLSLSDDGTYNIYDTQSAAVLKRHGEQRQYIRSGDFLFDGSDTRVAMGTTSGLLHYRDISRGTSSTTCISAFSLRALRFLNDTQIICGDEKGVLRIFDTVAERLSGWTATDSGLTAIRINPRDQSLLCGFRDGLVIVFPNPNDFVSDRSLQHVSSIPSSQNDLSIHAEAVVPEPTLTRRLHESIVGDLLPLPNGLLISCSDDQTIKTSIPDSLSVIKTTSLDGTAINNLLVLSDLLVATTDGGIVFVLDTNTQDVYARYGGHSSPVRALCKISDCLLATGDRLGEVRIWNVRTRETLSVNRFRERVIELGYQVDTERLFVITEAELASLQLDSEWFLYQPTVARTVASDIQATSAHDRLVDANSERSSQVPVIQIPVYPPRSAFDDIEIKKTGRAFQLSSDEDELVRLFTRSRGGTRCDLQLLSGGLSGARVFRAKVFDPSGAPRINAVAKLGTRAAIQAESDCYDREVSRLSPTATPRRLETRDVIGSNIAGVFYSLAEGYDRSEFQVAADAPSTASQVIDRVRELTAPWRNQVPESRCTIADVRQRIVDDETLTGIAGTYLLDWIEGFERGTVQIRRCTIHGDLHGGNILVDRKNKPTIIDYGEVADGPAAFDPITLEFSHLFHPEGPLRLSDWPNSEQARRWKTEDYLVNSPMSEISRSCWQWAESVCAGHREIAAAAYAYLVMQLKYPDTNKNRVLDLLTGVRKFFEST